MAPDTKRMVVKLDASIVVSLSAALHSSEFAENANMARRVIEIILVLGINRWAPVMNAGCFFAGAGIPHGLFLSLSNSSMRVLEKRTLM